MQVTDLNRLKVNTGITLQIMRKTAAYVYLQYRFPEFLIRISDNRRI